MWIWIGNEFAKFHAKNLKQSEKIPKSFRGLLSWNTLYVHVHVRLILRWRYCIIQYCWSRLQTHTVARPLCYSTASCCLCHHAAADCLSVCLSVCLMSCLCIVSKWRNIFLHFLSASLYVSKRGAYWDRLCRDVVGRWLVGWLSRACTVAKRCILGL